MKDTLIIDGKIYISSRRAAEMSKYSNDYIGQLCRGGKVAAKMMGRVWFVEKDSLFGHKKAAEEVLSGKVEKTTPLYKNTRVAASPEEFIARQERMGSKKSPFAGRRILVTAGTSIIIVAGALFVTNSGVLSANANGGTASVSSAISNFFSYIGGMFGHHDATLTQNQEITPAQTTNSSNDYVQANTLPWNGIAVAPSTGSSDDATKKQIQSSFSDNVTITPDATGNAGVIKPVFKQKNGDDFVYVLVPVKDGKATSTSARIN